MSLAIGDQGELAFQLECIKQGFMVSKPISQDSKYDLVVDTGDRIYKVQVKTASRPKKYSNTSLRYEFSLGSGSHKKTKYSTYDIDLVVCVCLDVNDFYFIFPETFKKTCRINIYRNSKHLKNIFQQL